MPICEHCNLNCKGCGAFSPLVKECFIDVAEYEKDCSRLSLLCGGTVEYIDLLGGEPLLHPEITKILDITRKYFNGQINIITNGIKLLSMTEEFWSGCKKNNIAIVISGYPIRLDYKIINRTACMHDVALEIRGFGNKLTIWNKFPIDLDGGQKPFRNFLSCFSSNFCLHLEHGKIGTCAQPFVIRHFNAHFNKNMTVSEENFIDIYKVSNLDEILSFLSRPIPFCKYCNLKKIKRGIKWDISKKEISEWV
ncbi:MAG: radical SAM protein [Spirochaetaceae bacterium]|nr:radical SAM protein [Spirochaetaceae bacterium]